jgi:hypothetical protein
LLDVVRSNSSKDPVTALPKSDRRAHPSLGDSPFQNIKSPSEEIEEPADDAAFSTILPLNRRPTDLLAMSRCQAANSAA